MNPCTSAKASLVSWSTITVMRLDANSALQAPSIPVNNGMHNHGGGMVGVGFRWVRERQGFG